MIRNYILGAVLLLTLLGFGVFAIKEIFIDKDNNLTKEELILHAITDGNAALLHDNKPVIKIDSVFTFEDRWHVATIKSLRSTQEIVPVKVVLVGTGNTLRVVAGPDTHFTEPELLKYNVPDSVIIELQKQ